MEDRLNRVLANLASVFDYGELMLSTDPAGFFIDIYNEITSLRALVQGGQRLSLLFDSVEKLNSKLDDIHSDIVAVNKRIDNL